jgi:hypothetical protein
MSQEQSRIASPLSKALAREMLAERKAPTLDLLHCFACGRRFIYRGPKGDESGRFCSTRCREAFDQGLPAYDPDYASKSNQRWYHLPLGPTGFLIARVGCGQQFDSKGLRACSPACEDAYRRRLELAKDPFRPIKRKCAKCDKDIPNWRKGRRVSRATRFCSDRCSAEARRKIGSERLVA